MRAARTVYEPGWSTMLYCPSSPVSAPVVVPTTTTRAPMTGLPSVDLTVPLRRPVWAWSSDAPKPRKPRTNRSLRHMRVLLCKDTHPLPAAGDGRASGQTGATGAELHVANLFGGPAAVKAQSPKGHGTGKSTARTGAFPLLTSRMHVAPAHQLASCVRNDRCNPGDVIVFRGRQAPPERAGRRPLDVSPASSRRSRVRTAPRRRPGSGSSGSRS